MPLFSFDAPTPGTGKGLLAMACAYVAVGRAPMAMSEAKEEEEWRKRLISTLREAPPMVMLDNVRLKLDSGALSSLLTLTEWTDRKLGTNDNITLPNRTVWMVTGNNIDMSGELTRRTVRIAIDAGVEHPEDRGGFRHPDLLAWVAQHRGELIGAALTLGRAWVSHGKPAGGETMGSFEAWARVMGGVLEVAGVPGLLMNRADQRSRAGSEREQMFPFLKVWHSAHGSQHVKARDVKPDAWDVLGVDPYKDGATIVMGHKLNDYADRPFGGLVLRRAKRADGELKTRGGTALWYVEPVPGEEPKSNVIKLPSRAKK